jgi:leader peptidase (prepilin peptidase)/N-methyltransferase
MTILQLLQAEPTLFVLTCGALGLVVGSFLNVVIARMPRMMEREWWLQTAEMVGDVDALDHYAEHRFDLASPRSRCPRCGHPISALENVPVVSYLVQRGRCRGCAGRISPRYPIVEVISAAMTAYAAWHFGYGLQAAGAMLLGWALIALTLIDFDSQLLPDAITLAFLWLGVVFNLGGTFTTLESSVVGAMAGYGVLWVVFQAFRLLTGKEGMGFGDFKLLGMLGAWLGWQQLALIVILSSLVGAVVGGTLIALLGHDRQVPIPFGPYLAAAGWVALLWGERITGWYLEFSGLAGGPV